MISVFNMTTKNDLDNAKQLSEISEKILDLIGDGSLTYADSFTVIAIVQYKLTKFAISQKQSLKPIITNALKETAKQIEQLVDNM